MLPTGALGGGANLGVAQGSIVLNTAQLQQAVATARGLAQQLQQAMNQTGSGSARVVGGFAQMAAGVRDLRGELVALSASSGILTQLGLSGALSIRNYNLAFKQFTGTLAGAEAVTNRLIEAAGKYGLEWEGVLQLGRALLPSLQGNTEELDKWISRAARLRSLFPAAPRGSETIAISEFLAGQTVSLQRRFNIPASVIDEATNKFQDLGQALDYILERRGATEEAAVGMANSFVGLRNELTLILAQGFTPLFQALQPILASFREFLTAVRESNPGLLTFGAGLIAITAAAAPALLLLNQLAIAAERLKALGLLSGAGRLGVGVGAAVVGGQVGLSVTRGLGQATGQQDAAQATWQSLGATVKQLFALLGYYAHQAGLALVDGFVWVAKRLVAIVSDLARAVAGVTHYLASWVPAGMGRGALNQAGAGLDAFAAGGQPFAAALDERAAEIRAASNALQLRAFQALRDSLAPAVGADTGAAASFAAGPPDVSGPVREWARAVERIEREAGEARLQATQDYERQRTETIAQYNLSALREQADFDRQRARAAANFARQLAEFQQDAAQQEARWQRDLNEKLAEVRADSNERMTDLETDYAKDRERAERDHRDRLLDAAGRLDAVAVAEEQRRFAREQQDAEENFTEQRDKIQEALDERIADELKSHQRRLEDARDANAEQLADMQRAFEEQRAEEDFERAIQQQRRAEDYARQLEQMDVAQAERLAQIDRQAAQERAALDEAFIEQLNDLGVYQQAWRDLERERLQESLALFDEFWAAFKAKFPDPAQIGPQPQSFPTSWSDLFDRTATPGGSATTSTGGRSVSVGEIVVNAAPGQDEREIARQVRAEMEKLLVEAGQ